jgi:hypothetical protein
MTRFLCSFFDKNLKEFQYSIKEKTYTEKFLGVSSPDIAAGMITTTAATLYNDEIGFAETLMYGIEKQLLLFYIMMYTIVDIGAPGLPYLAFFMTVVVDRAIVGARVWFGMRNFSRKTLIDQKFVL